MSQQQMLEGLSKLRCGACGCDSVRMFRNPHGLRSANRSATDN